MSDENQETIQKKTFIFELRGYQFDLLFKCIELFKHLSYIFDNDEYVIESGELKKTILNKLVNKDN